MQEIPKIPNQDGFNKPQGPSIMEQLPLQYQVVTRVLMSILEALNRIDDRLAARPIDPQGPKAA